ncbi:MAG: hypothetical protein M1484_04480 [Patescibacteria group bacterium]|nr:hypothetical protein [Patescibacteria group bacterium]MCL5432315.1 hypothetical protein [Patescibacteria group bacterium]
MIRTIRSGGTAHTEASVLQFVTDLLKASGVLDTTGTQFKAQAQASPDMTALINVGRAYILNSGGNGYPIYMDASSNVTFGANSSGNPRIDSVILYIDLSASPNADSSNVAKLAVVQGTPGASPNPPNTSQIQAAIGASNPYIILANVTVASGAVQITNGNIADVRTQISFRSDVLNQDQWVTVNATTSTTTLDLSKGKKFIVNLQTATTTLALLNVPLNCKSIVVRPVQDATGSRVLNWWSGLSWPGGTAPTLTTTANKADEYGINFLTVTNDSTNTSEGFIIGQSI